MRNSRELRKAYNDLVDDVHDTWVKMWDALGPHPYETGDYRAHIKKKKIPWAARASEIRAIAGKGIKIGAVWNDSDVAHFVEYGTHADNPNSKSPWGPNTPTREFAPMRKTWARFEL